MKTDKGKTKEQLIGELAEMRQRVAELESLETERKQAEEELRNFKTAADTAVFGLGIGTAEHLTYVNRSFAEMHGYSPDELIGQNYSMFYTKEQLPVINKLRERLSAGGSFIEEEVWHKKKDGTSFPTLMTGHAIRDDEGNPSLIVGTTIDITERRQADEELRQSEERYKAIFELGSDVGEAIIINQDMPGQIAAQPIFNDEWIRITGYSRDELLHMSYFDLIHPAQRDTAINRYRRRLQGEKIRDPLELTVVRKDGTEIPIEALGTLTNFRGQNATIVYARDITKRRQAEEALQLRAYLLNNASDSIIAADLEGNIIYANDTACRARGYTKEEMLEMHLRDTVAPELLSLVPGRIQNIFEKGYFTFESEHKRKDGSTFPVEITSRNIKLGERTVILSSMRDITERKQVEAALTESQELYRAVMELGGRLGEAIVLLQDDERGVGMHVYINDVWCDITGYSREELLDISMADLIHHKDRDAAIARYASRLSGEDIPDLVELSIIRKNGTEIPVEVTYAHSTYKGKSANVGFIREIAERKKTETALRQSEEFNSSVLRNSPNPVMVANSDTSIRYVNPALENLTGYSLDELVGQKVPRPWWPEEMYEKLESDVKIAYRRGFRDLERCFQKKSGERFWVQITATPVIIDGKFHHFIDNWVDITEHKRMEEEIIRNRDYLERLNDSLTDMIFEVKLPERTIRYINKAVETVLGYRLEECLGQSIEMIYPSPEVFRELGRRLRKGVERGDEITTSEHELKRKDGGIITVEGRTSYLREAGKVVSAFSVVRDITEHKQAEEALADEVIRRRILVEQSRDGIVILNQNGKVYESNKRFAEMLGYSSEEMKQLYVWDWDYQIPREQLLDMIKSDNATGKHFETKHRRKDGTIYDVEISTNAAVFAGQKLIFCVCRDITERKRAEQRIKDSEQRYISAEQVGNFGHFSRYLDTDRLVWSAGSYRIFGVDPNQWELTRENAYKIVHPQDLEKLRKANEKAGCGTKGLDTEFRIIRPDGKERVIHAVADVTLDNAGKPERLFGTMQDVTERKQAEEQLKAERDKLQAMMSGLARSGIGIDIVSQDYRVRFQNETLQERFGNIIGKLCYEHYMALKEPCDFCPMVKAIRTNEIESVELTGADGRDYELLAAPLPNPDGTIDQAIEVIRDVTERKQAEEALRENEEKLLRMFESVSEGITVTDLNGIIIEANAELARIHGLSSPSEMLGKSALDWIHPLEHDRALANFKKTMLEDGASGVVQYRLLKADGSDFPGELSTSVLKDASGTPVGFIATTRDITERRQLEEEQQRSARLESIGTLAGGIAHDFNNVLTGILGNISLAKRHVEPKSKADDRLMEAEKASLRARDLTQQLLTFSRGGTPVKKIVSIAELIPDSAGFALRGSNVSGQFSLPDGLWQVEADEGQMHQVITNLVLNACEAMPEGGVLNISAENMVIKKKGVLPLPRGNYVAIAIEDHGVGISEGHLDRIFEPFFTTKQKGSGLGLATTYSIIRKHDGYITVESTPTIGTTFRIYLPASDKPAPEKEEAVAETPLRGRGKILVMDDEEMIREMLNQMLPPAGYEVELTRDGAEALERYRQAKESGHPFDAVIIDLTVPGGMGGREAIKKLLEIDAGVKAIVSSGYATDPVMANYKEYGFTDIVTKPYSVGDVEKILRNIINEKRRVKGRKSK